jgi:hypothetical protein
METAATRKYLSDSSLFMADNCGISDERENSNEGELLLV